MPAGQGRREGCFGKSSTAPSELPDTWGQVHQPIPGLAPDHSSTPWRAATEKEPALGAEHTMAR